MRILSALCFPLRRPLRLAALAMAQSLFLWLMIAAADAAYRPNARPGDFESIVILGLFFGSLFCCVFWLHGSSVASLQRAIVGHKSLAPLRAYHFKPRGIGSAITSLVLIVYFALFLALVAVPEYASNIIWQLRVMTPVEARGFVASHVLVIGVGTLVSLVFFVSVACHAAAGAGLHIDGREADLFHPRKNLATTLRYLFQQYLMLAIAAIGMHLGMEQLAAITPRGLGDPLVDPRATNWWVFVIFAGCAVVHYFWHASLFLLADYVLETGA